MGTWIWIALTLAAVAAPSAEQAAEALQQGDFAAAARGYRKLAKASPDDGATWFQLGSAEHGLERWKDAAAAFGRARELGHRAPIAAYNEACALARLGRSDEALAALEVALRAGGPFAQQAPEDPDLASIASDPRFEALLAEAERLAHPCEHDPRYDALDFWVGTFDVTDPTGRPIGENTITREQRGCVLVERWTDGWGGTGTSLTFLDPGTDQWRQLWIDDGGRVSEYVGVMEAPGKLVMEARVARPDGTETRSRGTWVAEPDGVVRQVFERPTEDGGWQVAFDARYVRRTAAPATP
jgi:hypothetical protein